MYGASFVVSVENALSTTAASALNCARACSTAVYVVCALCVCRSKNKYLCVRAICYKRQEDRRDESNAPVSACVLLCPRNRLLAVCFLQQSCIKQR